MYTPEMFDEIIKQSFTKNKAFTEKERRTDRPEILARGGVQFG